MDLGRGRRRQGIAAAAGLLAAVLASLLLAAAAAAEVRSGSTTDPLNGLPPGQDIVAGWRLTLDVTPKGYWFAIKDTADPCGFTLVSNESGVILRAEPLR